MKGIGILIVLLWVKVMDFGYIKSKMAACGKFKSDNLSVYNLNVMFPLSGKICNLGIISSNSASTCLNSRGSLLSVHNGKPIFWQSRSCLWFHMKVKRRHHTKLASRPKRHVRLASFRGQKRLIHAYIGLL